MAVREFNVLSAGPSALSQDVLISMLPAEILWRVFMINTSVELDSRHTDTIHAVTVTRHSSQVCRYWRELALKTSCLWGRILHLDVGGIEWRKELLRRANRSPLCVNGTVDATDYDTATFFTTLLESELFRLQRLDVIVNHGSSLPARIWENLRRPAPILQIFRIHFSSDFPNDRALLLPEPLFANHSPQIFEFAIIGFPFSVKTSSLTRVRRLHIAYNFHWVYHVPTAAELLEALSCMLSLEYLSLERAFSLPATLTMTPPAVHLRNLAELHIAHDFRSCAIILDRLTGQKGRSLILRSLDGPGSSDIQVFQLLKNALSRCARDWFSSWTPSELNFSLSFNAIRIYTPPDRKGSAYFDVQVSGGTTDQLADILPLLLAFNSSDFDSVTELAFSRRLFETELLDRNVQQFLLFFPSVQVLLTDLDSLDFLLPHPAEDVSHETNQQYRHKPVFPLLRTVCLNRVKFDRTPASPLLPFLGWRKEAGAAVEVLDITTCHTLEELGDLSGYSGLKVCWKEDGERREYIC